jgi:hypothetical protein
MRRFGRAYSATRRSTRAGGGTSSWRGGVQVELCRSISNLKLHYVYPSEVNAVHRGDCLLLATGVNP